jgi:hypothetical protein
VRPAIITSPSSSAAASPRGSSLHLPGQTQHQEQEEDEQETEVFDVGAPEEELLQQQAKTPGDRQKEEEEVAAAAVQARGTVSIAAERSVRPQPVNPEASAFSQYGQLEVG